MPEVFSKKRHGLALHLLKQDGIGSTNPAVFPNRSKRSLKSLKEGIHLYFNIGHHDPCPFQKLR